ncbi:sporulation integral membrane protein YtvI [Capillibacterium thermochitinicola]|uniref:Sporulation integral membrane protein YtvI n=1 Tax=Capillibacterium thermochitinicola TaxID=2699427 RepID=A0A8J6HZ87_9FIRM|nr:sporulation integral membrane protein YtvI [Capillibacterium thermochitinicola]MBA2132790.1 sporulation integral membrane protein YtvI [Capillibacterium thermochitinicola]
MPVSDVCLNRVVAVAVPKQIRLNIVFFLCIFLLFLLIKYLFPLVRPFFFGLIIAYLIEKPVTLLGRWCGFPRQPAVIIVLLLTLCFLGLGLTLFFAGLYQETKELLLVLPTQIQRLGQGWERLKMELAARLQLPEDFWQYDRLWMENLRNAVSSLLARVLNVFRGFPVFLFNLLLSGFTAYFLSRDRDKIRRFFFSFFPFHWRQTISTLHRQTLATGWRFLKTQLLLAMITGLLSMVGLAVLGFTKPWVVGSLLGLLDFLPLVGPALVYLPWIGWQLAVGKMRSACFLTCLFLFTLGIRQLLEVRLVGATLGLHPLLVLASLYIGVKTLGVGGLLFGSIFCVLIRTLYQGLFTYNLKNVLGLNQGD